MVWVREADSKPTKLTEWESIRMPMPKHSLGSLFEPQIVKITASGKGPSGENARTFSVPRGMLCAYSEYFTKVFEWKEREGLAMATELDNVQPWVFATFVTWMWEQRLRIVDTSFPETSPSSENPERVGTHLTTHTQEASKSGIPASYLHHDGLEEVDTDPFTWQDTKLFELYIYADRYANHLFRHAIFEIIEIKHNGLLFENEEGAFYDNDLSTVYMYHNLPETSPLRRFMMDHIAHHMEGIYYRKDEENAAEANRCAVAVLMRFPLQMVAELSVTLVRIKNSLSCQACDDPTLGASSCYTHEKGDKRPSEDREGCYYHEHQSKEERKVCREKRKML